MEKRGYILIILLIAIISFFAINAFMNSEDSLIGKAIGYVGRSPLTDFHGTSSYNVPMSETITCKFNMPFQNCYAENTNYHCGTGTATSCSIEVNGLGGSRLTWNSVSCGGGQISVFDGNDNTISFNCPETARKPDDVVCSDTDEGVDYYTKGERSGTWVSIVEVIPGIEVVNIVPITTEDRCVEDTLIESFCDYTFIDHENGVDWTEGGLYFLGQDTAKCPNGCEEGACIRSVEPKPDLTIESATVSYSGIPSYKYATSVTVKNIGEEAIYKNLFICTSVLGGKRCPEFGRSERKEIRLLPDQERTYTLSYNEFPPDMVYIDSTDLVDESSEENNELALSYCGNGVVENNESCDDGNFLNNDTCSSECKEIATNTLKRLCVSDNDQIFLPTDSNGYSIVFNYASKEECEEASAVDCAPYWFYSCTGPDHNPNVDYWNPLCSKQNPPFYYTECSEEPESCPEHYYSYQVIDC